MAGQQPQKPVAKPSPKKKEEPPIPEFQEDTTGYSEGFKHMFWLLHLLCFLMIGGTGMVLYWITNRVPENTYFAIGTQGNKTQLEGLRQPNLNQDTLLQWAEAATTQVMTFGFDNLDERMGSAQHLFTPDGWKSFQKALKASGLAKSVVQYGQLITAIPLTTPTIVWEGLADGHYVWIVNVAIIETIRAGKRQDTHRSFIMLFIVKMPTLENPMGIGINTWRDE